MHKGSLGGGLSSRRIVEPVGKINPQKQTTPQKKTSVEFSESSGEYPEEYSNDFEESQDAVVIKFQLKFFINLLIWLLMHICELRNLAVGSMLRRKGVRKHRQAFDTATQVQVMMPIQQWPVGEILQKKYIQRLIL